MAVFNKKHIGAMILRNTGAAGEYADSFEADRSVMYYPADGAPAESVSSEDKSVIDRLEEERNYITYAVIAAADGSKLYLVVTDEVVKRVNINIEYDADPFDGVLRPGENGSGYLLSACADTPEAAVMHISVAADNGLLHCI